MELIPSGDDLAETIPAKDRTGEIMLMAKGVYSFLSNDNRKVTSCLNVRLQYIQWLTSLQRATETFKDLMESRSAVIEKLIRLDHNQNRTPGNSPLAFFLFLEDASKILLTQKGKAILSNIMYLRIIRDKIAFGAYDTNLEFSNDVRLMFSNSKTLLLDDNWKEFHKLYQLSASKGEITPQYGNHLRDTHQDRWKKSTKLLSRLFEKNFGYLYPVASSRTSRAQDFDAASVASSSSTTKSSSKPIFRCQYLGCTRSYKNKNDLAVHERIHTGIKPYICSFPGCEKAFAQKAGITNHMMLHEGNYPFKCPFEGCNKAYVQKGNLQKHQLTHAVSKSGYSGSSFICRSMGCLAVFESMQLLKKHQNVVHLHEYPCPELACQEIYTQFGRLKSHYERVHPLKVFSENKKPVLSLKRKDIQDEEDDRLSKALQTSSPPLKKIFLNLRTPPATSVSPPTSNGPATSTTGVIRSAVAEQDRNLPYRPSPVASTSTTGVINATVVKDEVLPNDSVNLDLYTSTFNTASQVFNADSSFEQQSQSVMNADSQKPDPIGEKKEKNTYNSLLYSSSDDDLPCSEIDTVSIDSSLDIEKELDGNLEELSQKEETATETSFLSPAILQRMLT